MNSDLIEVLDVHVYFLNTEHWMLLEQIFAILYCAVFVKELFKFYERKCL